MDTVVSSTWTSILTGIADCRTVVDDNVLSPVS